jgi:hypothetical protein
VLLCNRLCGWWTRSHILPSAILPARNYIQVSQCRQAFGRNHTSVQLFPPEAEFQVSNTSSRLAEKLRSKTLTTDRNEFNLQLSDFAVGLWLH